MEIGFEQHQQNQKEKNAHNAVVFVATHFAPRSSRELHSGTLSTDGSNCFGCPKMRIKNKIKLENQTEC